jgi:hypothetical protein
MSTEVVGYASEEALKEHMKDCCPQVVEVDEALDFKRHLKREDPGRKPRSPASEGLVCYLCGERAVGLASFPWHLKVRF